jgi:hypothetical protein
MFALGAPMLCTAVLLGQAGWSVSGGRETFTYRDVASQGPPPDASPIEWTGAGPSLFIVHERATARRARRFTIELAKAGSFSYDGPVRAIAAPSADGVSRFEGRYEYRGYVLRDRFVRGFDAGLGIQGGGRRLSLERHTGTATDQRSSTSASLGGVASARFHRWMRWSAEVNWTNGLAFLRQYETHSVDVRSDVRLWGGGWLTDLAASGTVHVSKRAAVSASYLSTGEGTAVSHHSYVFARRRLALGVTYER